MVSGRLSRLSTPRTSTLWRLPAESTPRESVALSTKERHAPRLRRDAGREVQHGEARQSTLTLGVSEVVMPLRQLTSVWASKVRLFEIGRW